MSTNLNADCFYDPWAYTNLHAACLYDEIKNLFGFPMVQEGCITWEELSDASKDWEYEQWLTMQFHFQYAYELSAGLFVLNEHKPIPFKNHEDCYAEHNFTLFENDLYHFNDNEESARNIVWDLSFEPNMITTLKWYSSKEQVIARKQYLAIPCLLQVKVDMKLSLKEGFFMVTPSHIETIQDWIAVQRLYVTSQLSKEKKNGLS